MTGSALAFVLARLDQLESPVFSHEELARFPAADLATLLRNGVLFESDAADEVERPSRFRGGGRLAVRRTAMGIFGCPREGDPYFDPLPLTEDDIRQHEVALATLVARLREENQIDGAGYGNHGGLIPLGQKAFPGAATVGVYLSLPNADERDVIARCQRLSRPSGGQPVVFVTPRGVALSSEGRCVLDGSGVVLASLSSCAATGSLAIDWDSVLRSVAKHPDVSPDQPVLGLTPSEARVLRVYREWEDRRGKRRGIPVPPTLDDLEADTGASRPTVSDARQRLKAAGLLEQIPGARRGTLRLTVRGLRVQLPSEASTVKRSV